MCGCCERGTEPQACPKTKSRNSYTSQRSTNGQHSIRVNQFDPGDVLDHDLHPFGIRRHSTTLQMLFLPHELLRELDGPLASAPTESLVKFRKQRWRWWKLSQQSRIGADVLRCVRARHRAAGVNEEGRVGSAPIHAGPAGGEVANKVESRIPAEKSIDIGTAQRQRWSPAWFLPFE